MSNSSHTISRRSFITACGQAAIGWGLCRSEQALRAAPLQTSVPSYGTGAYGQTVYVGTVNQVYLPIVNKGEK